MIVHSHVLICMVTTPVLVIRRATVSTEMVLPVNVSLTANLADNVAWVVTGDHHLQYFG